MLHVLVGTLGLLFLLRAVLVVQVLRVHIVRLGDDLPVGLRRREALYVLLELVTQDERVATEERLGAHNLHRRNRVELVLELLRCANRLQ